ncbi:MAG: fluoride efflux transporter CrcB [Candidatus Tectomicrobia bacterium]|uniref:Fluoride-specific ion channel FluC n=1 Tax=Tectimicrobiota bacterium TaxID=2528274 RepID=A0A937W144_UNCTE|nr:fluoride efflux transporter CrcB [Candidatus Tectomicrobia bacterium]
MDYLVVGLGGFLGANVRYLVAHWVGVRYGTSFPYGTLVINVSGSFLIGLFLALITERLQVEPHWRLFFSVGFLGAYTTFSTFSFESLVLLQHGWWLLGLMNILGSVLLGLGAALAGMALARLF